MGEPMKHCPLCGGLLIAFYVKRYGYKVIEIPANDFMRVDHAGQIQGEGDFELLEKIVCDKCGASWLSAAGVIETFYKIGPAKA